ncbi:extracellular solute-binding protein [Paenibacillus cymbidii]|uniref:extracellular solute-binding protein n=1 Tax=Paenibacillus cymbidii TaxID=1639034 RepID=UPI00107FF2D7|nr:extracellular solute-binding protein [Paenibacillus cymbidii]
MNRSFIKVHTLLPTVLIVMLALAACTSSNKADSPAGETKATASASPGSSAGKTSASPAKAVDPLGKYDPPIELTSIKSINATVQNLTKDGISYDKNMFTELYEKELGIKLKYVWAVPSDQFNQKKTVSIASGDLPDVFPVNLTELKQLTDAGLLADLTEVYNTYASPLLKKSLTQGGTTPFDVATINGKLMALPETNSSIDGAHFIWIRTDWLEKLKLTPPKTMNDVVKIAEAFAKLDPDGNGKADTVGLAMFKDLWGGYAGLEGFFNGYHAYPRIWVKDASGKLVFGGVQPAMKDALKQLQDMYKAGLIDKEFGVKDSGKVAEDPVSGRNGLNFGQQWNPVYPFQTNHDKDPNAQWTAFPLVSFDNQPARPQTMSATLNWWVVKKGAKNPEALVKIFNIFMEKNWGTTNNEYEKYYINAKGENVFHLALNRPEPPQKNLDAYLQMQSALVSGDGSKLTGEAKGYFEKVAGYKAGNQSLWGYDRIFGTQGSYLTMKKYNDEKLFISDEFSGAPTPTMVEKKATLDKLLNETYTKIILGAQEVSEFDKVVEQWNALGGTAMTKEVNDWYGSQKK